MSIEDAIAEIKEEIRNLRNRIHTNKNDIAAHFSLLMELKSDTRWITHIIDDNALKINEISGRQNEMARIEADMSQQIKTTKENLDKMTDLSEKMNARIDHLALKINANDQARMQEKIDSLTHIKNIFFSAKFWYTLLMIMLFFIVLGDKYELSQHINVGLLK